ncbi:hypothetical protein Q7P35_011648 [Cladosporium inversicolor]
MTASGFWEALDRLGLSQYHDGLVQEAFDSWDVLADITEEDLDALGVKLGHRRVLQRAIADYRKSKSHPAVVVEPTVEHIAPVPKLDCSPHITSSSGPDSGPNVSSRATTGNKRKYRRHPKPDENAPDRPPSAYVLFSNQVREHLKGKDLSFTEIAKTVGERWQVLAPDDKATYESRSQAMKDRYYAQLAEYKKTQDYAHYQNYLEDFKAKHEPSNGKRLKEDKNASPGRRSSDERLVSSPDHRESCASSIEQYGSLRRPSTIGSPQIINTADWRPMTLSNHTSPEIPTPDLNKSPRHHQPAFASINAPQSNTPTLMSHRRTNTHSGGSPMNNHHPMAISTSMAYGYHPMLATQTSTSSTTNSPPLVHSRRPTLASESSLPSLRHSDSLSSSSGSPLNTSAPSNSAMSRGIPNRELPPPFPARQSGFTSTLPPMKAPGSPSRYSPSSSGLATLLRAGEHLASNGPDVRLDSYDSRY